MREEILRYIVELSELAQKGFQDNEIMNMDLIEDLKFDSIQMVELITFVEEKYDMDVMGMADLLENMQKVQDFIQYIENNTDM